MQIGFFSPMFFEANGTAKATRSLAIALAKQKGVEVHVYAPALRRFKHLNLHPDLHLHHLLCVRVNADPEVYSSIPFFKWFRARSKLFSHLDVVHTTSADPMGLLGMSVSKHQRIPKVITHHSPFEFYIEEFAIIGGKFWNKFLKLILWEKIIYNRFDVISTPTISKKRLINGWGIGGGELGKPTIAISNGLEEKYFKNVDPGAVIEKYRLNGKKILLYASRMAKEKNIREIVISFKQIHKKVPTSHLVLVGSGPEVKPVTQLICSLGMEDCVTQTGFVLFSELLQWYRAADVSCIWSYIEAQGLVILEAMAQGTPTVGTDATGIKDVIIDGKTGYLVKNLREFIKKVVFLFQNDDIRKEMGKNARKQAEVHNIDNVAKIWVKIYKKLIRMYPYKGPKPYKIIFRKIWEKFANETPGVSW
ncbi:MAG: glycosyltransferase [Promethearchaeota archaeon]